MRTDCWAPAAPLLHWWAWCWCLPVTLVEQTAMECQRFVVDAAHLLEPVLALCFSFIRGGHIFSHPCRWERDFLRRSLTAGHPAIRRHFSLNFLSIAIYRLTEIDQFGALQPFTSFLRICVFVRIRENSLDLNFTINKVEIVRITRNPLILQYPNTNCTEFAFSDLI